MKRERRKSFGRDKRGVSPVIGVLLMVAVTVIMAAVIMAWSSTVSTPETPNSCGVVVSRQNSTLLQMTVMSIQPVGASIASISWAGTDVTLGNMSSPGVGSTSTITVNASPAYLVVTGNWADGTTSVVYNSRI